MSGKQFSWVIAIGASFIGLLYFLYQVGNSNVTWYEFYRPNEKQPYDLSVASSLIKNYFPKEEFTIVKKPLTENLPSDSAGNSCYFFTGHSLYLSYSNQLQLFEFVRQGNQVFIAANDFPKGLLTNFFDEESMYDYQFLRSDTDSMVKMNFLNLSLKSKNDYLFEYNFFWEKQDYVWQYFPASMLNNPASSVVNLGILNDSCVNFIKIPYGRGTFYFHCNPIVFTNYYLKESVQLQYAEKVFSHLKPAAIYWDEYSKIPPSTSDFKGGDIGNTETPLRYVLSQPPLKYAWYVLLLAAGLFLVFRTKRTQRMIPVLEQNENTSLEYIKTISRLYFSQNDHRALAMQKMKLFQAFIRSRYNLHVNFDEAEFINKLSVKSQISFTKIKNIETDFKTISNMSDIDKHQLQHFHLMLEEFCRNCK